MKGKIILSSFCIIILCLCLVNQTPSADANKYESAGGLDPNESYVSSSKWSFSYGVSSTYGVYIRDVIYNHPINGITEYVAMINIPWIEISKPNPIGPDYVYTIDIPNGLSSSGGPTLELKSRSCTG